MLLFELYESGNQGSEEVGDLFNIIFQWKMKPGFGWSKLIQGPSLLAVCFPLTLAMGFFWED